MPKLIIMRDQTSATGSDIVELKCGVTATDAIIANFPDGLDPNAVQVYFNKTKMVLPSESDKPSDELLFSLIDSDIVTVILEVKGIELTIGQLIAIALVSTAVSLALTPKIPADVGNIKQSPNNTLQGQTNIARPYQAYPLIFGSPISFPDLTGEPLVEYIDNIKVVTQLMNVGVGLFDIANVRAGQTPLDNFLNATSTIYEPVNKIVTVPNVTESFAINEIDGQEILGADVGIVVSSFNLTENGTELTTYESNVFVFQVIKDAESDSLKSDYDLNSGSDYTLVVNYNRKTLDDLDQDVFEAATGTGRVSSVTLDIGGTFYTVIVAGFNGDKSDVTPPTYNFDTPFLTENIVPSEVGPINIGIECDELWVGIRFERGLKSTVKLKITMTELDGPQGSPIIGPQIQPDFYMEYTENTLDQQFRTFKGVIIKRAYYRLSISRDDISTSDSNRPDNTKIEAVYAINKKVNATYGNVTLMEVSVPATIGATSLRENKINLDLTSKLISYDVNTGGVITTPTPSRKMADALLHLYVDFYGLDANTLALDELYEIQNRLDAIVPRLATFDFTFDDIDVSLDERMDAILNVARCYKWLDGDVYRFGRNEQREYEATTITRRDLAQDSDREYSLTYSPQLTENFDSIKLEYVDPTFNKKAYIYRKLDAVGNVIDGIDANPKTIELAGCREEFNAINRAELEMRALIYQRYSLTDTMLSSGMFLDKGDMVLYAEQYNGNDDLFDGEILSINGNIATVSESVIFDPAKTYQIHYTIEDGSSLGPFAVSAVAGEQFQFSSTDLTQAYVRDSVLGFLVQTGSRYIISTVEEFEAARWTVIEKEAKGRDVQITMVNYNDKIYDFDGV